MLTEGKDKDDRDVRYQIMPSESLKMIGKIEEQKRCAEPNQARAAQGSIPHNSVAPDPSAQPMIPPTIHRNRN